MTIATIFTTIKRGGEIFRVPLTKDFYLETLKQSPFYNRINSLANKIERLSKHRAPACRFDREKFFEAAGVCIYAHRKAVREVSGLPYADHPISAAERAVEMLKVTDENELIAYLLHDVVEESEINLPFIKSKFGKEVAGLVDGVTKITQLEKDKLINEENIDKFVSALRADIRVLRIKMIDRWLNLEDVEFRSEESRRRNCQEALDFYVPLGVLAGFIKLARFLSDVALRKMNPDRFSEMARIIISTYDKDKPLLEKIKAALVGGHKRNRVLIKPRTAYEVDQIATMRGTDARHLSDVVMMQVTVPEEKDCYSIIKQIHSLGIPQNRYWRDYVKDPKSNGYRSIHTGILVGSTLIRFQVRTPEMQKQADEGVLFAAYSTDRKFHQPPLPWLNTNWIKIIFSATDRREKILLIKALSQAWLASVILQNHPSPGWSKVFRDVLVPRGVTPLELAFITDPKLGMRLTGAIHKDMPKPIDKPIREAVGFIKLQVEEKEQHRDYGKLLTNPLARLRFFDYMKTKTEFERRQYFNRIIEEQLKAIFLDLETVIGTIPKDYDQIYSLIANGRISAEEGVRILADKIGASKSEIIALARVKIEGESKRLASELALVRNILPLERYGFLSKNSLDLSFSLRSPIQTTQLANFIDRFENQETVRLVRSHRLVPPIIDDLALNPHSLYFSQDLAQRAVKALQDQGGQIYDFNLEQKLPPATPKDFVGWLNQQVAEHIASASILFLGGTDWQVEPFKAALERITARASSPAKLPLMVVFKRMAPVDSSRILEPLLLEGFKLPESLNIFDISYSPDFILKAIAQRIGVVIE